LTSANSYFDQGLVLTATATQLAITFPGGGNTGILDVEGNGYADSNAQLDFGVEYISRGGYYLGYEYAKIGNDWQYSYADPGSTQVIGAVPTSATPEPSSIFLLVSGLAGMGGMIRRKLKA